MSVARGPARFYRARLRTLTNVWKSPELESATLNWCKPKKLGLLASVLLAHAYSYKTTHKNPKQDLRMHAEMSLARHR